jgi:hypothetical protein
VIGDAEGEPQVVLGVRTGVGQLKDAVEGMNASEQRLGKNPAGPMCVLHASRKQSEKNTSFLLLNQLLQARLTFQPDLKRQKVGPFIAFRFPRKRGFTGLGRCAG